MLGAPQLRPGLIKTLKPTVLGNQKTAEHGARLTPHDALVFVWNSTFFNMDLLFTRRWFNIRVASVFVKFAFDSHHDQYTMGFKQTRDGHSRTGVPTFN